MEKVDLFLPWHFSLAQNRIMDSNVKHQGLRIELSALGPQMLGLLGGTRFVLGTVSNFHHPDTPMNWGNTPTVWICS